MDLNAPTNVQININTTIFDSFTILLNIITIFAVLN